MSLLVSFSLIHAANQRIMTSMRAMIHLRIDNDCWESRDFCCFFFNIVDLSCYYLLAQTDPPPFRWSSFSILRAVERSGRWNFLDGNVNCDLSDEVCIVNTLHCGLSKTKSLHSSMNRVTNLRSEFELDCSYQVGYSLYRDYVFGTRYYKVLGKHQESVFLGIF